MMECWPGDARAQMVINSGHVSGILFSRVLAPFGHNPRVILVYRLGSKSFPLRFKVG